MFTRLFRRLLAGAAVASLFFCTAAAAVTSFELDPVDGAIVGAPGQTIGWGFELRNDSDFLVVTSAAFETDTPLGSFVDFVSGFNFFVVGPAPNGSTVWAQPFDAATHTGVGSVAIDPGAVLGDFAMGSIVLSYDLYSRSPLDPLFNPDTDTISTGKLLSALASVTVGVVPEPASWATLLAGIGLLGLLGLPARATRRGLATPARPCAISAR